MDRDNPLTGAITGGLGAVIAEVVAESLVDRVQIQRDVLKEMKEAGIPESTPGYKEAAYQQKLRPYVDTARLVVASVIVASGHDPSAAISAATNALENNFAGDHPWPEIGSLPDEMQNAVREGVIEAVVEEAEVIWNDPDTFVEETTIGFVPGGDIARKLHRGEEVTYLDLAMEAGVTCMPYVGGTVKVVGKTGAKIINKVVLKVTQKLEKGAKSGKAAGRSTNVDALDLAGTSKKLIHKNSLDYTGPTHVYKITNPNGIHKVGESAQGMNKYGNSKRAEMQARKLQRETGLDHETKILAVVEGKREARRVETSLIQTIREEGGLNTLPGNKGIH